MYTRAYSYVCVCVARLCTYTYIHTWRKTRSGSRLLADFHAKGQQRKRGGQTKRSGIKKRGKERARKREGKYQAYFAHRQRAEFYNCTGRELIAKLIGAAMRVRCFQCVLPFVRRHIARVVSAKWISNAAVFAGTFRVGKISIGQSSRCRNELVSTNTCNFDELCCSIYTNGSRAVSNSRFRPHDCTRAAVLHLIRTSSQRENVFASNRAATRYFV